MTPSHLDTSGDNNTPPIPHIRVASAHRSSTASGTPHPQVRNLPEPYGVHEFQPKTPERNEAAGNAAGGEGQCTDEAVIEGDEGLKSLALPLAALLKWTYWDTLGQFGRHSDEFGA